MEILVKVWLSWRHGYTFLQYLNRWVKAQEDKSCKPNQAPHSPCRQKMDNGKIALTPNVEQSGMLGSAFEQNAGSIPALAIWERQEQAVTALSKTK